MCRLSDGTYRGAHWNDRLWKFGILCSVPAATEDVTKHPVDEYWIPACSIWRRSTLLVGCANALSLLEEPCSKIEIHKNVQSIDSRIELLERMRKWLIHYRLWNKTTEYQWAVPIQSNHSQITGKRKQCQAKIGRNLLFVWWCCCFAGASSILRQVDTLSLQLQ